MIHYRTITTADPAYQDVWQLREDVLRKPLGLSLRDEDLSAEAAEQIVIAEDGNKVVGCLMLRILSDSEGKLRQMAVAEDRQGRGIGAGLLREAEKLAKRLGLTTLSLHARAHAIPFYERSHYTLYGEPFEEVGIPHRAMKKDIR